MNTCVVVGHRGMLGSYLAGYIPFAPGGDDFRLVGLDVPEIDITDGDSVGETFARLKPSVVVNCAAYTDVDGAETNREAAFRVNAVGPELLAQAARATGALLVHISTDFVFDGHKDGPYCEEDVTDPATIYGKSKLAGEKAVAATAEDYIIVRTAWLYGPNGRNFVETILRAAREKGSLSVVDDQRGSPTYTGMLSRVLWRLIAAGTRGTFHVAGAGACTWYDLAGAALELAGISAKLIPCSTDEFPRPAPRPQNSVLDCSKAEAAIGEKIPDWHEGLRTYVLSDLADS